AGLALRRQNVAAEPDKLDWQRELAVSYELKGRVLQSFADFEGALAAFAESLKLRQKLTVDQSNAMWYRDLSISYERIGDIHLETRELDKALAAVQGAYG